MEFRFLSRGLVHQFHGCHTQAMLRRASSQAPQTGIIAESGRRLRDPHMGAGVTASPAGGLLLGDSVQADFPSPALTGGMGLAGAAGSAHPGPRDSLWTLGARAYWSTAPGAKACCLCLWRELHGPQTSASSLWPQDCLQEQTVQWPRQDQEQGGSLDCL